MASPDFLVCRFAIDVIHMSHSQLSFHLIRSLIPTIILKLRVTERVRLPSIPLFSGRILTSASDNKWLEQRKCDRKGGVEGGGGTGPVTLPGTRLTECFSHSKRIRSRERMFNQCLNVHVHQCMMTGDSLGDPQLRPLFFLRGSTRLLGSRNLSDYRTIP
jgi:hypothetical protein